MASSDQPFAGISDTEWGALQAHLIAAASELVGTTMFLWFAFAGTQAAAIDGTTATSIDGLLFISLSFGFSLMVTAWAHYRISGGLFNPAVRQVFPTLSSLTCLGNACTRNHC